MWFFLQSVNINERGALCELSLPIASNANGIVSSSSANKSSSLLLEHLIELYGIWKGSILTDMDQLRVKSVRTQKIRGADVLICVE